jgi:eukaryotic-like serine/threonine-protein kinase
MTPERHERICDLLYQALELDSEEREPFLNRMCASDVALRQEVESLLSSGQQARSSFLQSAAFRTTLQPGAELGGYQVVSLLGSGGMGEVYRARDLRLGREVAIKVLPSYLSSDHDRLRRFEQEARAAAALNHPNILAVFHLGTQERAPYMVSELLEGETLREHIKRAPLPRQESANLAAQIAKGLAAAHEKGIVHRDLKPENLFVTEEGRIKILDFGLAKLTQSQPILRQRADELRGETPRATEPGTVMGTMGYMSPEQVRGQPVDLRSDIFSFGAVLYEMLTGCRAFQGDTPADTMSAILNQDPPASSYAVAKIPLALQRLVRRCLKKNPEERYQRTSDLVRELETLPPGRLTYRPLAYAAVAIFFVIVVAYRKALLDVAHHVFHTTSIATSAKPALTERNLTANSQDNLVRAAAVSRDGKYVAYADDSKTLNLLLTDSGDVHQLALDSSYEPFDWFPDGIHLLVRHGGDRPGLWKYSSWDSSLHKLWEGSIGDTGGGPVRNAAISPDGAAVAFVNGEDRNQLWLMGAEGEEPHKVLDIQNDGIFDVVWSPAGTELAFIHLSGTFAKHQTTIESCDLKGQHHHLILSEPKLWGRDGIGGLAWLSDGRIVYAISNKLDEYNLWSVMTDPEGGGQIGKPEPLTDWRDIAAPGFQSTADGKRLILLKRHSDNEIFVGPLRKGMQSFAAKTIISNSWRNLVERWSIDSKSILFSSKRNGRWTILQQDTNAKMPQTLVGGSENYRDPILSVTGMLLYNVFASGDVEADAGNWRLMSTPIEGGSRSILMTGRYTFDCGVRSPSCLVADLKDDQLVFSSLDPLRGQGGEIARAIYHAADRPHWSLSPDGSRIAMIETGGESSAIRILSLQDRSIKALPLKGWRWKYLTNVSWAADGRHLFAITLSDSSSALISIDPGGTLTSLREVDPVKAWLGMPVASPDGRLLAFTKRRYASDLVLLENF